MYFAPASMLSAGSEMSSMPTCLSAAVEGLTEAQALIAYLQNLGLDMRNYGGTP